MQLTEAEREMAAQVADLSYPRDSFSHGRACAAGADVVGGAAALGENAAFRRALQAYAAHHDAAEMYNETVTVFYLLLIRDRMDRLGGNHAWEEFRSANADILGSSKTFLEEWYPDCAAFTPEAKAAFCLPG